MEGIGLDSNLKEEKHIVSKCADEFAGKEQCGPTGDLRA